MWLHIPQVLHEMHVILGFVEGNCLLSTLVKHQFGQIIATSRDLTPNGGLVREILYFMEIYVGEIL